MQYLPLYGSDSFWYGSESKYQAAAPACCLTGRLCGCTSDSLPYQILGYYIYRFCGPFFYEFTVIIWQVFIFYGWSVVLRKNPIRKNAEILCNFLVWIKNMIGWFAPVQKKVLWPKLKRFSGFGDVEIKIKPSSWTHGDWSCVLKNKLITYILFINVESNGSFCTLYLNLLEGK